MRLTSLKKFTCTCRSPPEYACPGLRQSLMCRPKLTHDGFCSLEAFATDSSGQHVGDLLFCERKDDLDVRKRGRPKVVLHTAAASFITYTSSVMLVWGATGITTGGCQPALLVLLPFETAPMLGLRRRNAKPLENAASVLPAGRKASCIKIMPFVVG